MSAAKSMMALFEGSSEGHGKTTVGRVTRTGQPAVATAMSGAIALVAVLLGGLNDVARFVTTLSFRS